MTGITNPGEKYFKDGHWTFDGTVWRPQNQLLAYREVYRQQVTVNPAPAGTNTLSGTAVPTGEVWVVVAAYGINFSHNSTLIAFGVYASIGNMYAGSVNAPAVNVPEQWTGALPMSAGEYATMVFSGVTLNDALQANFLGYKFKIAE